MKKIIVFILVLSSAVLIALSIQNFSTPTPEENSPDIIYSSVIEKNTLDTLRTVFNDEFNQADSTITAVFFMYSKNCNNCFNEVHDYIELINQKDRNIGNSILSYGIFHHVDANVAKRFKVITDLDFDNVLSQNGNELADKGLLTFRGENANNQLVFINSEGDLFCRILLPSGITTTREKKSEVIDLILNPNT